MPRKAKRKARIRQGRQRREAQQVQSAGGKPYRVPGGLSWRVFCPRCGADIPEINATSSNHCSSCENEQASADAIGRKSMRDREQYEWASAFKHSNATESLTLSDGVGPTHYLDHGIDRLQHMGLAPNLMQERPLNRYDDKLHMRDERIDCEGDNGRNDYIDGDYPISGA